ncbi:MAG TPA: hypothetical protein VJK31_13485 [Chthoniobacterales bacterium]|jgi:hypothetical protein|nr:hypothetical protein [Chthoniobacterales bacterium]
MIFSRKDPRPLVARKHMSDAATQLKRPTLKSLAAEMRRLRERLEDVEDLIELRSAIERNAGKPGVPWEKVKAELDLN